MKIRTIAIIVTYNGAKWIDKCFGSLEKSTLPIKVLAIDNASTDGTPQIIREKYPKVEVIETGKNLGFGKANNIGLKRVLEEGSDFAFLLNQDAWIEPDTIEKLIDIQLENKDFNLLSPIHLNGKGNAIDFNFQSYLSNKNTPNLYSDLFLGELKLLYESKFVNAAAWLLTEESVRKIGGFDPLFKHYGEDDDYINRMRSFSYKIGVVPSAKIYHDRPQSSMMGKLFYQNLSYSRAILTLKKQNPPNAIFLVRKIISGYFTYYFTYLGKNKNLKNLIKEDVIALRNHRKVKQYISIQQNINSPFL